MIECPVDGVDELGVLLEHERAGDHAVDDERADEQRRRHVAGDAEVKSGMRLDATTALLADSEVAMPSSLPCRRFLALECFTA